MHKNIKNTNALIAISAMVLIFVISNILVTYQINDYCLEVSQSHSETLSGDLPCPTTYLNQSQKLDNNSYVTSEEKVHSLEDELVNARCE